MSLTATRVGIPLLFVVCCPLFAEQAASSETGGEEILARFETLKTTLLKELATISKRAQQEYDPQKTRAAQQELFDSVQTQSSELVASSADEMIKLITPHVAEGWAAEPLTWIASSTYGDQAERARELLSVHHLLHPKTLEMMQRLSGNSSPQVGEMLRAQLASSELPPAYRFELIWALADHLRMQVEMIDQVNHATKIEQEHQQRVLGPKRLAELRETDSNRIEAEAVSLFQEIVEKYPEEVLPNGQRADKMAERALFELQHLRIGMVAPDLTGEDLDGSPLKLSDYQGEIILLDFWASWCGPCMAEFPHLRELSRRWEDEPLVIIGVNGDLERANAKQALAEYDVNWRNYWSGKKGPAGDLPLSWNVRMWPTTYVIDGDRVIRAKHVRGEALEERISELLREAKGKAEE